jgi:hypothetical protein
MHPPASRRFINIQARRIRERSSMELPIAGYEDILTFSAMSLMTENQDFQLINPTFLLHTFVFYLSITITVVILFMYKYKETCYKLCLQ